MDEKTLIPFDVNQFGRTQAKHAKSLYRSLCIPSTINSYAQAIEYSKKWFLSKFQGNPFKSIYVDGKYIYDEQRKLTNKDMLNRQTPALAIVPNIDWEFTNENVDLYQFGTDVYQQLGLFKNSFFNDRERNVHLGLAMETLLLNFTYRLKVETRAQQMDLYKYIHLACRVGSTSGEDVDLDCHVPYELMVQLAMDLGFEVQNIGDTQYPRIANIKKFLSYLNTHSTFPFLYKYRTMNGHNEFFIRLQQIYIHTKPTGLSADDGTRQGHLNNDFGIELQTEVRFPAPKLYGYYSDNEHKIRTVFSAYRAPEGVISTCYTFKGVPVPDVNKRGWNLFLETTYEVETREELEKPLVIDFSELLQQGDVGMAIEDCMKQAISPSIFCELILVNGGEHVIGTMDWSTLTYTAKYPVRATGTYVGIYVDAEFVNNYIVINRDGDKNRIQHTQDPNSIYEQKE